MSISQLASTILIVILGMSCVKDPKRATSDETLVDNDGRYEHSTSAGNLIASALKKEYDLDFAFVPSESLNGNSFALVEPTMNPEDVSRRIVRLFNADRYSTYKVGTMKGAAIKKFVLGRSTEMLRHDLHVAGLHYDVKIRGGLPTVFEIQKDDGSEIKDDQYYRIAVERNNFNSFPGYWFRHGFSRGFRWEMNEADAVTALTSYLSQIKSLAPFSEIRSQVKLLRRSEIAGLTPISQVQGIQHMSPLHGHVVTVEGVVTVLGQMEDGFHEGRYEAYIQSSIPDTDPRSSEGVYIDLGFDLVEDLVVGSRIRVKGVVYEDLANEGLTRTGIREIESVEVVEVQSEFTPAAVVLGGNALKVPSEKISSFQGNVNLSPSLNLKDGLDFWESLEGMKVQVSTPTVVGFSGGKKDYKPKGHAKSYINVFVTAEGTASESQITPAGGLIIDNVAEDYNPEIIRIVDHHLAKGVKPSFVFEIGNRFNYNIEGVIGYDQNLFGGGEYAMYVTSEISGLAELKGPEDKPQTKVMPAEKDLTVASFNVENLSAAEDDYRFERIGKSISYNLRCPDIVNLVEIQDNTGAFDNRTQPTPPENRQNTSAKETLIKLIAEIKDCPQAVDYKYVEVEPQENQEGGEPGGNIRVAMIYNSLRVGFEAKNKSGALDENFLDASGSLKYNPGRVAASDMRLRGTRKPLISEFTFRGEKVFVIGNHFNSKGGDTSLWAAQQPPRFGSENRRSQIADAVNDFVQTILRDYPDANVIVTGDFNDFNDSRALKILAGSQLENLANAKDANGAPLMAANDQYTYNYGGNSQPLDFILVSGNLLKKSPEIQALHINTDFMWQVADHDPIISKYTFD